MVPSPALPRGQEKKLRQEKAALSGDQRLYAYHSVSHPGMRPVPAGRDGVALLVATQDSRGHHYAAASVRFTRIWRDGYRYAKAGIMLADFSGREAQSGLTDAGHAGQRSP